MTTMTMPGAGASPESATLIRLADQLTDAWNSHDPQRVAALCAGDYEGENVGEATPHRGPDGMAASVATYLAAFPDLHFIVDDVVVQGNRVVQVWHAHATHRGPLMNIPPTARRVEVRGASVLTFRGDKLYRAVYIWDVAGLLREIGLLPEL
jgi:steroid delta-isomerase-like uncharacterized protein